MDKKRKTAPNNKNISQERNPRTQTKSKTTSKQDQKRGQKWDQKQEKRVDKSENKKDICSAVGRCGGCQYLGVPYKEQLKKKQRSMQELLGDFAKVEPILGMENPLYYRNKVHHVFGRDRKGNILAGTYESNSHRVVDIDKCQLEDEKSQEIILSIKKLLKSFKVTIYDEDSDYGLLRHVLVRRGFKSGEIMVVLVITSPIFPSKNNFVKVLRKEHPEITTIVLNVNDKQTSMVLGERNIPLYGPGFIIDELCGFKFRISPNSFYQINPVQTEILYNKAMEYAGLTGKETVIDAYCGIGTIGMVASRQAKKVIGVELNPDAVRDARNNAKHNGVNNAEFICGDAGEFMKKYAADFSENEKTADRIDVVFMDPPRSGSTEEFIDAVVILAPSRVVYISCGPESLVRDLKYFTKNGYRVMKIQPVDMFGMTSHVETVCLLSRKL